MNSPNDSPVINVKPDTDIGFPSKTTYSQPEEKKADIEQEIVVKKRFISVRFSKRLERRFK